MQTGLDIRFKKIYKLPKLCYKNTYLSSYLIHFQVVIPEILSHILIFH